MSNQCLYAAMLLSLTGCAVGPQVAPVPRTVPLSAQMTELPSFAPERGEQAATEMVAAVEPAELPTTCASKADGVCIPPTDFARRLCRSASPDMALALFRKGTPWTRAYIRRDMEAWYVSDRPSSPKQLRYAEEVLIMQSRVPANGGVEISGSGSYDVFRWDGTCVSVMADEVAHRFSGTPETAIIPWKRLDESMQEALEGNKKIAFRNEKRREACRSDGDPDRCETAIEDLTRLIAEHVRAGAELPEPRRIP